MYRVRLEPFEGPLDLLLFFIRRDEIDIHDIPIARIADEFLGVVRTLGAGRPGRRRRLYLHGRAADPDQGQAAAAATGAGRGWRSHRPARASWSSGSSNTSGLRRRPGISRAAFEARQRLFVRGQAADERQRLMADVEVPVRATLFDLVSALGKALARSAADDWPGGPRRSDRRVVLPRRAARLVARPRPRRPPARSARSSSTGARRS